MLETLSSHSFAPLLNDEFALQVPDGPTLTLTLIAVDGADGPAPAATDTRAPFSITFLGPGEPLLEQAIYTIGHPKLGEHGLFIVPIGRDDRGTRYQAVFT